jgi:transcription elongation factor Elf1
MAGGLRGVQVSKFKNSGHLVRLAIAFAVVLLVLLLIRAHFIPKSFGQYGHYRGNALAEISSKPISYAGHQACEDCHGEVVSMKTAGKHTGVNCEACHGTLATHVENPVEVTPQLPDTALLCPRCHEANIAKPKNFPQVVSAEHSGGAVCKSCHQPHSPLLQPGGKQS